MSGDHISLGAIPVLSKNTCHGWLNTVLSSTSTDVLKRKKKLNCMKLYVPDICTRYYIINHLACNLIACPDNFNENVENKNFSETVANI